MKKYIDLMFRTLSHTSHSICKWIADFATFFAMHYNFLKDVSITLFILIAAMSKYAIQKTSKFDHKKLSTGKFQIVRF